MRPADQLARRQACETAGLPGEVRLVAIACVRRRGGEVGVGPRQVSHEALEAQHPLERLRPVPNVIAEASLELALAHERAGGSVGNPGIPRVQDPYRVLDGRVCGPAIRTPIPSIDRRRDLGERPPA